MGAGITERLPHSSTVYVDAGITERLPCSSTVFVGLVRQVLYPLSLLLPSPSSLNCGQWLYQRRKDWMSEALPPQKKGNSKRFPNMQLPKIQKSQVWWSSDVPGSRAPYHVTSLQPWLRTSTCTLCIMCAWSRTWTQPETPCLGCQTVASSASQCCHHPYETFYSSRHRRP